MENTSTMTLSQCVEYDLLFFLYVEIVKAYSPSNMPGDSTNPKTQTKVKKLLVEL